MPSAPEVSPPTETPPILAPAERARQSAATFDAASAEMAKQADESAAAFEAASAETARRAGESGAAFDTAAVEADAQAKGAAEG